MSQLSDAEKAKIRQEVLAEYGLSEKSKPKKFSDLIRFKTGPKESREEYQRRLSKLKAEGKLTFEDLIRFA
ncbi:hypothetical protein [Gimesia maris]|uniref:hypothetical protein n=1 Tax=Gimesia maris TaxID=122 RepID=UPI0030D99311|tara:strand:- start:510 stop:722 length:213 start_codon:yes stop_codon:yes gene_type:complete